jgi:hypothetical protein
MDVLSTLAKWNWPAIAQGVGALWVAIVASLALGSWRKQLKAQRISAFLDQLMDAVHEYILSLHAPIELKQFVDISVESHVPPAGDSIVPEVPGAVEYISRRGSEDSKKLFDRLSEARSIIARVQSLLAKGQMLGLNEYQKCRDSCKLLLRQHQRLETFASVIGSTHMNWEHPKVRESLKMWIPLDVSDIERYLQEQHVLFLEFVQRNYEDIS